MFSHWEKQYYKLIESIVIIGSGIVGLSTAISIKEKAPDQSVIVIDRNFPPLGASTKNAGFICFGSLTEILDDLNNMSEKDCVEIIKMRWEGAQILINRMSDSNIDIDFCGGFELFDDGGFPDVSSIDQANLIFEKSLGFKNYFKKVKQKAFGKFDTYAISMDREGQLNPMKMMMALFDKANTLGVKFMFGRSVNKIEGNKISFVDSKEVLEAQKIVVCTNGFAKDLFPDLKIKSVRNQVMTIVPVEGLDWSGVYHYDSGYYYWRRIGDRVLLGGARNTQPIEETTSRFGTTDNIKNTLTSFLETNLGRSPNEIETWWSGILGVGESKFPIVKFVSDDVLVGVRLGGMGVAIGSYLGEVLAEKVLG